MISDRPDIESIPCGSHVGRVCSIGPQQAAVRVWHKDAGAWRDHTFSSDALKNAGIGEGDEFRLEFVREHGEVRARFTRIPLREVSPERVGEVRKRYECRWTG